LFLFFQGVASVVPFTGDVRVKYSAFDGIDPAAPLYDAVQRENAAFIYQCPETNAP
jgi:hypothetical protein